MASLAACMDGIDQPDAYFRISYMDVIVCVILDGAVELVDQDAMRSTKIELGTGQLLVLTQLGAYAICIDPEQSIILDQEGGLFTGNLDLDALVGVITVGGKEHTVCTISKVQAGSYGVLDLNAVICQLIH